MTIVASPYQSSNPWLTDPIQRQAIESLREQEASAATDGERSNLAQVIDANIRSNWVASTAAWAQKQRMGYKDDPDFNVEDYLLKHKGLADNPVVQALYHAGQFRGSQSEDEFGYDYANGVRLMEQYETIGKASRATSLAGGLLAAVADPLTYATAGAGAVGGRLAFKAGMSGAQRLGVIAGSAFATDAAFQVYENQIAPISDQPGLADNAFRSTLSTVLGLAFGHLGTRGLDELRQASADLLNVVTPVGPEFGGIRNNQRAIVPGLDGQIALRQKEVADYMAMKTLPANVLVHEFDGMEDSIAALRKRAEKEGAKLILKDDPLRSIAKDVEMAAALDEFGGLEKASGEEVGQGLAAQAVGGALSGVSAVTRKMTIGGRLGAAGGLIAEVFHTLRPSGDGFLSHAAATDPNFSRLGGAEGLKLAWIGQAENVIAKTRQHARNAAKEVNPFTGEVFKDAAEFSQAIERIRLERQDRALGYAVKETPGVGPTLAKAAEEHRAFYNDWGIRLDETGQIEGPVTLRRMQDELAAIDPAKAPKKHAKLKAKVDELAESVKKQGEYAPIRFSAPAMRSNPDGFVRLHRQYHAEQRALPGFNETLEPDVLKQMELPPGLFGGDDAPKTILDLPQAERQVYKALLATRDEEIARSIVNKFTHPSHGDAGVADSAGLSFLERRTLQMPRSVLAPYLVTDATENLSAYAWAMSGRSAVRRVMRLNSTWDDAKLKDGTAVEDGKQLIQFAREHYQAKLNVMKEAELKARGAGLAGTPGRPLSAKIDKFQSWIDRRFNELDAGLAVVENRRPYGESMYNTARVANTIRDVTTTLTMAGNLPRQLNDLHSIFTRGVLQQSGGTAKIASMIAGLNEHSAKDLQRWGSAIDGWLQFADHADLEHSPTTGTRFSRLARQGARTTYAISGLNALNHLMGRIGSDMMSETIQKGTRKMIRYAELVRDGAQHDAAVRKAGMNQHEYTTLRQWGITPERARQWQERVFAHGVLDDADATPLSKKFASWDDYMANTNDNTRVAANFDGWDMGTSGDGLKNRELFDAFNAIHTSGVRRNLMVTPGAFDKPFFAMKRPDVGLVNQLSNYFFRFANHTMPSMAQAPLTKQMGFMMTVFALTAVGDAIANHLRKRRSFEETAKAWQENPKGEIYTTLTSTGMLGFLQRPLAFIDASAPWSPARQLGASNVPNNSARYAAQGNVASLVGPAGSFIERGVKAVKETANWDKNALYDWWKLTPFNNWIGFQIGHQITGAPIIPETIKR